MAQPFFKWSGGKRRLLPFLTKLLPKDIPFYCEPFFGGGALFFALEPERALIGDENPELVLALRVAAEMPEELKKLVSGMRDNAKEHAQIAALDRRKDFSSLKPLFRAARFFYLIATSGPAFRLDQEGFFNAPYRKGGVILKNPAFRQASLLLSQDGISMMCADFAKTLAIAPKGSFAYLDPPRDFSDWRRVEKEAAAFGEKGSRFLVTFPESARTFFASFRRGMIPGTDFMYAKNY